MCRLASGSLATVVCFRCWPSGSTSMFPTGSRSTTTCPQPSVITAAPCSLGSSDKASSVRVSMKSRYYHHRCCYSYYDYHLGAAFTISSAALWCLSPSLLGCCDKMPEVTAGNWYMFGELKATLHNYRSWRTHRLKILILTLSQILRCTCLQEHVYCLEF